MYRMGVLYAPYLYAVYRREVFDDFEDVDLKTLDYPYEVR